MNLKTTLLCLSVTATIALPVHAGETDMGKGVSVELNAMTSHEDACTLTFLVINHHASPIDKLVYETVLFDTKGQVDRLALFNFGALPVARPRVRQFTVPGVQCEKLGKILINGASTCDAPDLDAAACEAGLTLSSRTAVAVQG